MIRTIISTALKVATVCLIVGLILSAFGIDPWQLYGQIGAVADDVVAAVAGFAAWAWKYVLIGAVVVVPIWFVLFLLRGRWRR